MPEINLVLTTPIQGKALVSWTLTSANETYNAIVQKRHSSQTEWETILTKNASTITGGSIETVVTDTVAPDSVDVIFDSISFVNTTKQLTFDIDPIEADNGSIYYFKVILTGVTTGEIIEAEGHYSCESGIKEYRVLVDGIETSVPSSSNSIALNTTVTTTLASSTSIYYIHAVTVDKSNNISEVSHTIVDIQAPPKVTTMELAGRDISVSSSIGYSSLIPRSYLNVSPVNQIRGMTVYYDVQLVDATSNEVLLSVYATTSPNDIELNFSLIDSSKVMLKTLQIKVKTYTLFGGTEGYALSGSFLVDNSSPAIYITANKSAQTLLPISSVDTGKLTLSWTPTTPGPISPASYEITYRKRYSFIETWSEWTLLGSVLVPNITNDVLYTALGMTGYNVYEFRIRQVNVDGTKSNYFIFPDTFSDLAVVNMSNSNQMLSAVRLPVEALVSGEKLNVTTNAGTLATVGKLLNASQEVTYQNGVFTSKAGTNIVSLVSSYRIDDGESLLNTDTMKKISTGVKDAVDDYKTTTEYSGALTSVSLLNNSKMDIYLVTIDLDSSNPLFSDLTFTAKGFLSLNSSFISRLTTNRNATSIPLFSTYNLFKYGTLYSPSLNYIKTYDPVSTTDGINDYSVPIGVNAAANSLNNTVGQAPMYGTEAISLELSYTLFEGDDSSSVLNYIPGSLVNTTGSYIFYATAVYTNETYGISIVSEETTMAFNILNMSSTFSLPTIRSEYNEATQNMEVFVNLNVTNKANYTYLFKNVTTGVTYTSANYTESINSDGLIEWKLIMSTEGTFDLSLTATLNDVTEIVTTEITVFKFGAPTTGETILSTTFKDSNVADTSPFSNNVVLKGTSKVTPTSSLIVTTLRFPDAERVNKNIVVMDTSILPMFINSQSTVKKYVINANARNRIYSHDGRNSSTNITSGTNASYQVMSTQELTLTSIDNITTPPVPSLNIASTTALEPFFVDGSALSVVNEDITITVGNTSNLYTLKCFIDGQVVANGTKYTNRGSHIFIAVFMDNHNFTTSSKIFNFEIKGNFVSSPPLIDYTPKTVHESQYTISIKDKFADNEGSYVLEYKDSILNSWKPYTVPFVVNQVCTITARKTNTSGLSITSTFDITSDMLFRGTPAKPIIDIPANNKYAFVPSVKKIVGNTYSYTLNGLPYTEGTVISNYTNNVKPFVFGVTVTDVKTNSTNSAEAVFIIDSMPPTKPLLNGLEHGKIMKIDTTFKAVIGNKQTGVVYTITVDNKVVSENSNLLGSVTKLYGQHKVIVQAKKTSNNMINFSYYYVDVNGYTPLNRTGTDVNPLVYEPNIDNLNRTYLLPLQEETNQFDTNGELVVDSRTGNLSIVSNGKLIEITKDLSNDIRSIDGIIGRAMKTVELHIERLSALERNIVYIKSNTVILQTLFNELTTEVNLSQNKITTTLTKTASSLATFNTLKAKVNAERTIYNNTLKTVFAGLDANISSRKALRTTLLNLLDDYEDPMTKVALSLFNLESIQIEANKKVLTTTYNSFKAKHDAYYTQLVNIIKAF